MLTIIYQTWKTFMWSYYCQGFFGWNYTVCAMLLAFNLNTHQSILIALLHAVIRIQLYWFWNGARQIPLTLWTNEGLNFIGLINFIAYQFISNKYIKNGWKDLDVIIISNTKTEMAKNYPTSCPIRQNLVNLLDSITLFQAPPPQKKIKNILI